MSRPAAAVHRVIKAYDVRGLVGEELDEQFVADVGGAFARLVRDGASQVVIGYDMRASSPSLAAAFAEGVMRRGSTWCGSDWRRPISSTSRRDCWTVRAPCSPPAIIRPPTTASSCAVPAPSPSARTPGSPRSARTSSPECLRTTGRAARSPTATCWPTTASFCGPSSTWPSCVRCASPSTPATAWAATPHPPCWARSRQSRCCRCTSNSTAPSPTTRPTRWTRPTSSICRPTSSRPAPTSDWPSTATPTGVSSSTKRGIRFPRRR